MIVLRSCQKMKKQIVVNTSGAMGRSIHKAEYPAWVMIRPVARYIKATTPIAMRS
jgi:hypothetical protein